jgi:aminoglycoside 3-N-acetyltransferase
MVSFRDIFSSLKQIGIGEATPVIVHASLSAFGDVQGGSETLLGALLTAFSALMMPTFTYQTMVIPENGPEENGINYGSGEECNGLAEFYSPQMPADRLMGVVAELLRQRPNAMRSMHPILSFTGVNVEKLLNSQTIQDPFAPLGGLVSENGWVILAGVDHKVNSCIHYAEKIVQRKQFIRWALTQTGVHQCIGFPGCSEGFIQAEPALKPITFQVEIGDAVVQALPLQPMMNVLTGIMINNPLALLCHRLDCASCNTVRHAAGKNSS